MASGVSFRKRFAAVTGMAVAATVLTAPAALANTPTYASITKGHRQGPDSPERYYPAGTTVELTVWANGNSSNTITAYVYDRDDRLQGSLPINHTPATVYPYLEYKGYYRVVLKCSAGGAPATTCDGGAYMDD